MSRWCNRWRCCGGGGFGGAPGGGGGFGGLQVAVAEASVPAVILR